MNVLSRSVLARYRMQGVCRACGRKAMPSITAEGVCSVPAMCISNRDGVARGSAETTDPDRDEIERRKDADQQRRDAMEHKRFKGRF